MPDRLHHCLPLLQITPTRALGNDETPRRASETTVEDVLEEYRVFSRRRIPIDRESAEYYQFDEDLSVMLYRLRQFIDTSMHRRTNASLSTCRLPNLEGELQHSLDLLRIFG